MQNLLEVYLKKISKYPLLTKKQEQELAIKVKKGDKQAFDTFVTSNLRLVVSVALKFKKTINILDAINEGNIGLMRSITHFDHTKHFKFGTYAIWWINQSITSYVYYHNDLIKQSVLFYKLQKFLKNFNNEHSLYPSIKQLSDASTLSQKTIHALLEYYSKISLDADINNNFKQNNKQYHDVISQQYEQFTFDIDFLLSRSMLTDKEKKVILLFFGFDDFDDRTLNDVGLELNLCPERVRQIKCNALVKIKRTILRYPNDFF